MHRVLPQPVRGFFSCWNKARNLSASVLALQLPSYFSLWINPIHFSLWINPILFLALSLLNFKKKTGSTEWLLSPSHACPRLLAAMVAAGCGVLRDTVGFMTNLGGGAEKVTLVFNLCGHRFAKFTLCRTKREAREVSPEPMRGKVRKPGRNFSHTQAKCQEKRSL